MAPRIVFSQLTPLVLNQAAPVAPTFKVQFDSAPSAVTLHLDALGVDLPLSPAGANAFSAVVPAAALTTGLGPADVNRKFIGHPKVTSGAQVAQSNVFGDVLTAAVPPVAVHVVAPGIQRTDHLVNLRWPSLADDFDTVFTTQFGPITQAFFAHFDDEYDFVHLVFARSYQANRAGFATRNDVQGIGLPIFDHNATYGSAGRLTGLVVFPIPTLYDGISPSTFHEIGHRWMVQLAFPPLQAGTPHWPISDLASDIMGYSIVVNGQPEGGQFNYTLSPLGNGNYQLVPNSQPKTFSDLAQYLMGMRPAAQVGSHVVFNDQAQPLVANGTLAGPVTPVSVNDVIAHVGPRVPDFAHAQKCFRVATLLVTRDAPASVDDMRLYDFFAARCAATAPAAYTDGFIHGTALPFSTVTGGAGCLDPRIKRHILIDASRDGGVWWFPQAGPFAPAAPHQGYAEAAEVAAALADPAVVRDAVAWDALGVTGGTATFAHDWLAYTAQMGERPQPAARPLTARFTPWPASSLPGGVLDAFIGLGWAKQPRGTLERTA